MTDIPIEVQVQILQQKIQLWLNTEYDAQLDAEVAQDIGDDQMKAQATQRMKNAKRAIIVLEKKLGKLGGGDSGQDHGN